MSEKENKLEEEEEEEEEEIVAHWIHEHPLIWTEAPAGILCDSCRKLFSVGERVYACRIKCEDTPFLHEECARMPRKIRDVIHPQHILILAHHLQLECGVCGAFVWRIGYECTGSGCKFQMHMRCAQRNGIMDVVHDDGDERGRSTIRHPSHPPEHQLRLFERGSSFKCDACGITRRGKSYVCTSCEFWIHERCASLPSNVKREDHHHSLSLAFHVPPQYLKYEYKCEVCRKYLMFKYWIYHCQICRYVVHINCAFKRSPHSTTYNAVNQEDIIRLPTDNVAGELIRPFVMRHGGEVDYDEDEMGNANYMFIHHQHRLTLVSSSSHPHDHKNEDEEEEDGEDEENWGKRSELICHGCITPISSSSPTSSSSSSSSNNSCYYYMSCSECRYYLHLACFNLPPRVPSLPFHHESGHELLLESFDKLKPWNSFYCDVCYEYMNGLYYSCSECLFRADIKCASLPRTIKHAAHPQQLLILVTPNHIQSRGLSMRWCDAGCPYRLMGCFCYAPCDGSYEFTVQVGCTLLPASTMSRRWDKQHRLLLTYDANLNHPGEFYCDECETEMNPKSWMYHCRHCDLSFHPRCFPTISGEYRNLNLGQLYSIPEAHPHSLTYQLLTTKRRCDACGQDCYRCPGFHCASCNFFVCFSSDCGEKMEKSGRIHPLR